MAVDNVKLRVRGGVALGRTSQVNLQFISMSNSLITYEVWLAYRSTFPQTAINYYYYYSS